MSRLGTSTYQLCDIYYRSEKQLAFEQEAEGVRSAVAEGNLAEAKKRLACLAKAAEKDNLNMQCFLMLDASVKLADGGEPEAVFTPEDGWKETAGESGDARTFLMSCTGELELAGDGQEAYEMRSELWTEETEAGSLYHIRVQVIGLRDQKIQVELATSRYQAEK